MTGEACPFVVGKCGKCGCEFSVLGVMHARRCPSCGSRRWRDPTEEEKLNKRALTVEPWIMEKTKITKSGPKVYRYWMASWREGGKVRHVHLGSDKKIRDREVARHVAKCKKAEALGIEW